MQLPISNDRLTEILDRMSRKQVIAELIVLEGVWLHLGRVSDGRLKNSCDY